MSAPPTAIPAKRLLAYLLDCTPFIAWSLILPHLAHLAHLAHPAPGAAPPEWWHDGPKVWLVTLATMSLPVWLYFTLLESSPLQATLAKRALGLRVETLAGTRLSIPRALLRTAVKLLPWEIAHATLLLPTPIADAGEAGMTRWGFMASTLLTGSWLAMLLLTKNHQAVHDLVTKTRVVARSA